VGSACSIGSVASFGSLCSVASALARCSAFSAAGSGLVFGDRAQRPRLLAGAIVVATTFYDQDVSGALETDAAPMTAAAIGRR